MATGFILIGIVDMVLLQKYKLSIPKIILISAGMGIVLFGVLGQTAGVL